MLSTTRSDRSNSNAKNNDLSRFTKYSIFFTYLYLTEATTSDKYRNNLGELLTNTKEIFYFTQRTTARGSKHVYTYIKARVYIHLYNYDIFLFQYNLLYLVNHIHCSKFLRHNVHSSIIFPTDSFVKLNM